MSEHQWALDRLAEVGESSIIKADTELSEGVVLVAFQVMGKSPMHRQTALMAALVDVIGDGERDVIAWWIAEDERYDRSDNDSAVFVSPGNQKAASELLFDHGLTPECNLL